MSIAKNTMYYSLALVYQKVLGFVFFILIGRWLGVNDTGQYVLAISFAGLFFVLADIGLVKVLIRKIAQSPDNTAFLYSQVFSLKLILSFITAILITAGAWLMHYDPPLRQLIYLAGAAIILDSFSLINWGVFRGYHNTSHESLGIVGFQTIIVGLGVIFLFSGLGVLPLMVAFLLGSVFNFLFSQYKLKRILNITPRLSYSAQTNKTLVKAAIPFALAGVFASIYTLVDTVMLSKLGCNGIAAICEQHVGWYGIAAKIILAFQFIPMALIASLFPAFSRQFAHEKEKLIPTFYDSFRYLAFIVIPVAVGIIMLASKIVVMVWGTAFLPAAEPLQILMVSLVFIFLTFPNGSLLNACGAQTKNTTFMGIAMVVNIILNALLIPNYEMAGAAFASLGSSALLFFLGFAASFRTIHFKLSSIMAIFSKIVLSSLIMGVLIYAFNNTSPLWLIILTGGIVYSVSAYVLGIVKSSDFVLIRRLLNK